MARPKEFDRNTALEAAKATFWRKGYNATTTEDLRQAMGIGRQSFYDSFVGKRETFLEVLRRYNDDGVAQCVARAKSARSPLAGLERILFGLVDEQPQRRALGCMGVSAICELGTDDPDVAAIGAQSGKRLEELLVGLVREAKSLGQVRASVDERAGALQINATMLGMKVLAKSGASAATLREVAIATLDGLAAHPIERPRRGRTS
ncbi:TetR/AcrR family transcriptional regulator [Pendulispora brunnea]|uniref:TetR/AcrR family transcriptional regulator n=1 Tax=Pendulispora brunnea TaxID=2905690 RepID=A0ABZ2K4I0_9BACT